MPRLLTALILTALLAVAGCHTFTESHDQHTVTAPLNDTFTVSLMSNPSTGYQWQLVEYNKKFVEPVGSPKYTPKGSSAGAPGTETFTFRGVAEGRRAGPRLAHPAGAGLPRPPSMSDQPTTPSASADAQHAP